MTSDELRQHIELRVVEMIKAKLTDGTLTEERSKEISRWVLDVLKPGMTFEQIFKAIPKLDDTYPELSPVVLPFLKQYEDSVVKRAQHKVENYIRHGQYDAAARLAKDAAEQNLKLRWEASAKPQKSI